MSQPQSKIPQRFPDDARFSSEREAIVGALQRVRRRLRLNRALRDAALLGGLGVLSLLTWRLLRVFGDALPAASALTILTATLLWVCGLGWLVRNRLADQRSLAGVAAEADDRAELKDELASAYWFLQQRLTTRWVAAQLTRAARVAQALDAPRLVPVRIPVSALMPILTGLPLLAIAWWTPPLQLSTASAIDGGSAGAQMRQVQTVRELMAQVQDDAAGKVEQALQTMERRETSLSEKQRVLAAAQAALEQRKLEAAAAREELFRAAERLRGVKSMEDVAKALKDGDARTAAAELEKLAGGRLGEGAKDGSGTDAEQLAREKDLDHLLQEAAAGEGKSDARPISSAAMKEAVDRLNKIAQQLDMQGQMNQASTALSQMQLAVAQRSALSAGRFAQQAANSSMPSPETGNTVMPGGTMFRAAAVARESMRSPESEGAKTGDATGESQADPLLGDKTARLDAQLKREVIQQESKPGEEGSQAWFYTESKEQKSQVQSQDVQARSSYAQAETAGPEGIAIRHRQFVKDYFMTLHEGTR